jgi:protein TonB
MEIPDKYEPIECSGIVVWSKPNGAAGIRFTVITESQKANLRSWLDDLERVATSPHDPSRYDEFTSVVSKIRAAQYNNADALNFILRRVSEVTSASGAAIALGTPENMVCLAAVGIAHEVGTQIPPGKGLTSEAVLRRKMVHCQNTRNDPRVGDNTGFGSAVILPLIVSGEVRGTLEAFSPRSYAFDSSAIDNLEKLSDAVVFVTYGIVTQRRLSAAKMGPSGMPAVSPSATGSFQTASFRAAVTPVPPRPIASAAEVPVAAASAAPMPVPVATARPSQPMASAAAPTLTPVPRAVPPRPRPITPPPEEGHEDAPAPQRTTFSAKPAATKTAADYHYAEQSSSALKYIVGTIVVLAVLAVPAWIFLLRPHVKQQPAIAAAPAPTTALPAETPVTIAPATVTVQSAPEPVIASSPKSDPVPARKATDPAPKPEIKPEPPKLEPIVLSASSPRPRPAEDTDAPISAPSPITGGGSVSNMLLPSAKLSAPELAAQTSTRSGGQLVSKVNPVYPPQARTMKLEGPVSLGVRVAKDGSVFDVHRLDGNTILAGAAIQAVKHWRYDPLILNGKPVEFDTTVTLNFQLSK